MKNRTRPSTFRQIYDTFSVPATKHDCGRECSPLNGGLPVCCSTENAIPVMERPEWTLLKRRTKMWSIFKPFDRVSKKIVDELASTCVAVECKGAMHCERDNRSLACRSFPFFPYITSEGDFIGISYYWDFEDNCWIISNLGQVDQDFVYEFVDGYEIRFACDAEEYEVFRDHSANMRRVFSRRKSPIPLFHRDGGIYKIMPHGGRMMKAKAKDFGSFGPYKSEKAFREAVAELNPDSDT